MSLSLENLNNMHLDVLKELGNIGAGNAVTALSKMLNKKVDMEVPKVKILDFNEVEDLVGGAELECCGIYFELSGDINGNMLFLVNLQSAKNLISMLMGMENPGEYLSEMDKSALMEIGNILAGSYLSSLSSLTSLNLKISIPALAIDMSGAILSVPAIQFGYIGDKVLLIETEFAQGASKVKGDFFLMPDINSYSILLKSLGVEV